MSHDCGERVRAGSVRALRLGMHVPTTAPSPPHRCGERANRLDMWVSMLWVRSQMQVCCCLDG